MYHLPANPAGAPGGRLDTAAPPPIITSRIDDEPSAVVASVANPFRRRWKLFATTVLGFLALVLVATLLWPRSYTTTTKLIAGNPGGQQQQQQNTTNFSVLNALALSSGQQSSETYAELFRQLPVAQTVADQLHLGVSADRLLSSVKVTPVNNTPILNVSATWRDPQTSARIANAFASAFVSHERDLIAAQATSAIGFLSAQLPAAEKRLHNAEGALARFEASHHIADVNAQTQSTITAAANVDAKIDQVQLDQQQANAQVGSLTKQLASISATTSNGQTVAPNPVLGGLRSQLAQVQVQLNAARQQYTDAHPTVQGLKAQVAELQSEIAKQPATIVSGSGTVANPVYSQIEQQLATARAASSSAAAQLAQLRTQRSRLDPQIAALPQTTAALAGLQRQQKLAEAVYTALQQKYNDAQVTKTTALSDVTITQAATPNDVQVRPDLLLNLLIGTVLALILGLAAVFVAEWTDGSIRDEEEVERELQLPVLGTVPMLPSGDREMTPEVRYLSTESYLQLVTAMRYSSDKPLRTIAITSPLQGDGKSTIAMGIGKALGELASASGAVVNEDTRRVIVIDADLRRPTLHDKLGNRNELGVSDILVGRARLADCVQSTKYPGLDLLSSGTPSPNPIKLLQSGRFDELLEELKREYATVILDAPALAPVFDAAVIAAKADGTVFVVSAGQTDLRTTKQALQRLAQVGVRDFVGTVVNRSTKKVHDYQDYFGFARGEQPALASESGAA